MQVYVRPFPHGEGKWQVSAGGGQEPRWRADGRRTCKAMTSAFAHAVFHACENIVMARTQRAKARKRPKLSRTALYG